MVKERVYFLTSVFLIRFISQQCSHFRYNKAFKSDSQRLAVSLRSSIAKRRSHLNAALYAYQDNQKGARK
ncbi:hypothetical protein FMH10_23535 [Vibrio parahaemolyticus]|nr:hypothetical protein [Vibrio parahaemolyticus]